MEAFELTRTGRQRQPSIGSAPGTKFVSWLLIIAFLVFTTGIGVLLTREFLSYKSSSVYSTVLENNAEKFQSEQCEKSFCDSKDCIRMALRILERMNSRADPCNDFYEFACGGISKPKSFPYKQHSYASVSDTHYNILRSIKSVFEDKNYNGNGSETVKKMKQLYHSCVDLDSRKKSTSRALEYWFYDLQLPLRSTDSVGINLHSPGFWKRLVSRLEEFRIHTVIEPSFISYGSDPIETIELNCVMPTFPLHIYLQTEENESRYMFRLLKSVVFAVLDELKMSMTEKEEFYSDVVQMETEIATSMQINHSSENSYLSEEHIIQIKEIWRVMLGDIIQDINIVSVCKYNLDEVLSALNRVPPQRATRYVVWRMLAQVVPFLGDDIQKLPGRFLNRWLSSDFVFDTPWAECSDFMRKELGLAVFKVLTETGHIQEKTAKDIKFLFLMGKGHLLQALRSSKLMDSTSKEFLISKIKDTKFNPGFSELIFQTETIDTIYKDLILEEDFFHSVMNIKKFKTRKSLDRLWYGSSENPISEISLDGNPLGFSSNFDYVDNLAHVDYGLLIPPTFFYSRSIPKYLKFGEYSSLVRAMSHVFDAKGISQMNIEHRSLLLHQYNVYAECLLNQTKLLQKEDVNNQDFKTLLLGDLIADIGSFQFPYKAFITHVKKQSGNELKMPGISYTKVQTYFIQVAQQYCRFPEDSSIQADMNHISTRFRVNLAASNTEDFAKSFHCPCSSLLKPSIKCLFL